MQCVCSVHAVVSLIADAEIGVPADVNTVIIALTVLVVWNRILIWNGKRDVARLQGFEDAIMRAIKNDVFVMNPKSRRRMMAVDDAKDGWNE